MDTLSEHRIADRHAPNGTNQRKTAEFELLLCLARAHLGPEEARRLQQILQMPIAWHDFLQLAERHRLLPLCARHLNRLASDVVPPAALLTMRKYTEQNVRRSLLLTAELRTILRMFEDAGIAAIAYKGPVLGQDVYGSVALRDMLDLDILVWKRDALRARQLLFERGYRSAVPTGEHWDTYLLWSGCNFPLVHDATGFVVELHWTPEACLTERMLAGFWQRVEYVSLAGMQVPTFARQDLLLLLCLHGCRHMWERLEWIAGLAELLRVVDVSWDELLGLASSLGARRALLLGVMLAHELLGAPVPQHVLQLANADRRTARLAELAYSQLFSDSPVLAHQCGFPFHCFQLSSKERLRDRVQYIRRRSFAPPGQDWDAWHMPWSIFRLYCAVRRLRLVATYSSGWLLKNRTPTAVKRRMNREEN